MPGFISVLKLLPFVSEVKISEEDLGNYLANRLLYPQVVSVDKKSLIKDQLILKAVIAHKKEAFYNPNTKRLIIDPVFFDIVPELNQLIEVYLDIIKPVGINYVILKPNNVIGTILTPKLIKAKGKIIITVEGVRYEVEIGTLGQLIVPNRKINVHFESKEALLLGHAEEKIEVAGGELGLLIDARLPVIKK